jgi:hypothetical protein
MRSVEIRLQPSELSEQMAAMRIWLDERRVEAASFACRDSESCVLLSLEFKIASHAEEFAQHFAGRASGRSAAELELTETREILESELSPYALVG